MNRMSLTYWFGYTLFKSAARALFGHRVLHREKLIEEGPVLIVANHQSFLDPPMLGISYEGPIYFLARKSLFAGPFRSILPRCRAIPIDQEAPDSAALKTVIRLLRAGERVLIFPEGSRSPDGNIHEAMPGIALILSKANVPVQPLRIHGAFDCLPMGSNRLRFRPVTVSVGDPISLTPDELRARGKEAQQRLAGRVMDAIRALPVD